MGIIEGLREAQKKAEQRTWELIEKKKVRGATKKKRKFKKRRK